MSIAQDLRTRARHRGLTPFQLVKKIGRLEREADNTACHLVAMATEIDELRAEKQQLIEQVEAAGNELSEARVDLEELTELRAFRDNTLAVSIPVGQRDIDPDDQPTAPAGINVTTLWAAMGHVPARDNPQATNPAHIPQPAA